MGGGALYAPPPPAHGEVRKGGHLRFAIDAAFNPRGAGSPAQRAALVGDKLYPTTNLRTSSRSEVGGAAIESSQRVLIKRNLKDFLKRSQVRSRSVQRSKPSFFALSAPETGLITAANPNFAQSLPR